MSGIIDTKSRILDTIVTLEGRRQLADGGLDMAYVSFTDAGAFYAADVANGSQDATRRVYLEACQLPQDDVTFQADDDGNLVAFRNSGSLSLASGRILSYSFQATTSSFITGSIQGVVSQRGQAFAAAAQSLLGASADNFNNLRVLSTHDTLFEDDGFALGPNQVTFTITNSRPISDPTQYATHIGSMDSVFNDPRFSRLPNFRYLPPVNKAPGGVDLSDNKQTSAIQLGTYPPWGPTQPLSYSQVKSELQYYEQLGYMKTISFDPTSTDNHVVGQFFELGFDGLRKLDIVDFGRHRTDDPTTPVSHVFFVGKVEVDEKGTDTFLHLFTMVFE